MTRLEGNRLVLEGEITFGTVTELLESGRQHVRGAAEIIDFERVSTVDSSAVALCLELLREAGANGHTLAFANLPAAMTNLARLYAVADIVSPQHG